MLFQDIIFWGLAALAIGGSLGVVVVRDLFRAALCLITVFVAVAGFFVMMNAEFLAVVQILIYAGAISILIIFGIMLTRDVPYGNLSNRLQMPAVLFSALLLATLVTVATATEWNFIEDTASPEEQRQVAAVQTRTVGVTPASELEQAGFPQGEEAEGLADLLVSDFVAPFEAAAVLLLASIVGALVLLRGGGES